MTTEILSETIQSNVQKQTIRTMTIKEAKAEALLNALRAAGGNKSKAAEILAVDRRTIYRLMAQLNVSL